jgi:hypothetical protein
MQREDRRAIRSKIMAKDASNKCSHPTQVYGGRGLDLGVTGAAMSTSYVSTGRIDHLRLPPAPTAATSIPSAAGEGGSTAVDRSFVGVHATASPRELS